MGTPLVLSDEQAAEVRVLYGIGYSLRELAQVYDCSKQAVARAVLRAGGTLRPRGNVATLKRGT